MDVTLFITPLASALIAAVGAYVATKNSNNEKFSGLTAQIAALSTQVAGLRRDVEKHNNVIERTFKLESDMRTAYKRIDELKESDMRLEDKIERK